MLVKVKPEIVCKLCGDEIMPHEDKHMVDGRAVSHQDCWDEAQRAEADKVDMLIDDSKLGRRY